MVGANVLYDNVDEGQFPHWQNELSFSFQKKFVFKIWNDIYFFIIYYNIVMWVVKLFRV
jgi:hypothetical protein